MKFSGILPESGFPRCACRDQDAATTQLSFVVSDYSLRVFQYLRLWRTQPAACLFGRRKLPLDFYHNHRREQVKEVCCWGATWPTNMIMVGTVIAKYRNGVIVGLFQSQVKFFETFFGPDFLETPNFLYGVPSFSLNPKDSPTARNLSSSAHNLLGPPADHDK